MIKSDKDWEAESDARTLTEAATIESDKARRRKATTAAKRMLKDEQVKATALKQVASGKKPTSRPVSKRKGKR